MGTGGVLVQGGRVVAYTSSKFTQAEVNYATTEQELLVSSCASFAGMEVLPGNVHRKRIAAGSPLWCIYKRKKCCLGDKQGGWKFCPGLRL